MSSVTKAYIPNFNEIIYDLYAGKIAKINNGESLKEGLDRFNKAIKEIVTIEINSEDIGIVAHASILSLFASQYSDFTPYELHQQIQMPDMAILNWDTRSFIRYFGE